MSGDPAGSSTIALFDAFPRLAAVAPRIALGTVPTPLEAVRLALPTGGTREVLVKRDDLTSVTYGGNKVRKLEFLLAAARRKGARRLITAGAAGSHHALATTVYGRQLGFEVSLVLFPQRMTGHVRDVLRQDHALGAELRWTRRMEGVPLGVLRARRAHARDDPYVVPPGGSDAVGTLGYVNAGVELAGQLAVEGLRPSAVVVAAGTLGTAAGLALGLVLAGQPLPVRAVRITSRLVASERALRRLVRATAALLATGGVAVDVDAACACITLVHDQLGDGYGRATEAGRAAAAVFEAAGLVLDATYTAKAAADLLAASAASGPPLFLHTLSAVAPAPAADVADDELPAPFAEYLRNGRTRLLQAGGADG
jgi:1-aminocyclopropane-1-carboxylate deaminase/D-cysteine desulfhydrase-like pyridoxal-dependent ACC family enzyme